MKFWPNKREENIRKDQAEKDALLAEGAWLPISWNEGLPEVFDTIQRTRNSIANAIRAQFQK